MNIKSLVVVSTLAVCSCGGDEQGLNQDPNDPAGETQLPSLTVPVNTDVADVFGCIDPTGDCTGTRVLSNVCKEAGNPTLTNDPNLLNQAIDVRPTGFGAVDFFVAFTATPNSSRPVILTIHGGDVEKFTSNVARRMTQAPFNWDFYDFEGFDPQTTSCRSRGQTARTALHVTATNFNDAEALREVRAHTRAISLHGDQGLTGSTFLEGTVCVGGRNATQRGRFMASLNSPRFTFIDSTGRRVTVNAVDATSSNVIAVCQDDAGVSTANIVNKVQGGQGLQIETSFELREAILNTTGRNTNGAVTTRFYDAMAAAMSP